MISLDQVYLLEQKVESAVEKIQQLQAENDALRNKCTELTNALSAKSEQLSNFESDQSQIETGIKKALDRLNSIENSVLKTASQNTQAAQAAKPAVQAAVEAKAAAPVQSAPSPVEAAATEPSPAPQAEAQKPEAPLQSAPSFDTMDTVPETTESNVEESFEGEEDIDAPEDDNHDGLGFDIF
ncbi:cell division protein ZapB [Treponema bryantii]|uniref:cell division protein ZapB n=1 Tax=Treponema bryantii TaxID=163 RepID=UPI0003B42E84|nr:cell division protein ZapB [Treponema bryantii]